MAMLVDSGFVLIAAAAVGWYVASYAVAWAFGVNDESPASPRVVAAVLPVGVAAIIAGVLNRPALAIGLPIAAATVSLTLAAGMTLIARSKKDEPKDIANENAWPLLLPATLLLLIIGFQGTLHIGVIGGLLLAGLAGGYAYASLPGRANVMIIVPAIALAVMAGWLAVEGVDAIRSWLGRDVQGPITATLLAPALLLPTLGQTTTLASLGRWKSALGTLVAVALANLLIVLPLTAAACTRVELAGWGTTVTWPHLPPPVWRIDGVLLLAATAAVLPIALGRFRPGAIMGVALVGLYGAYVVMWAWVFR